VIVTNLSVPIYIWEYRFADLDYRKQKLGSSYMGEIVVKAESPSPLSIE
jgi:hypothetical protein